MPCGIVCRMGSSVADCQLCVKLKAVIQTQPKHNLPV